MEVRRDGWRLHSGVPQHALPQWANPWNAKGAESTEDAEAGRGRWQLQQQRPPHTLAHCSRYPTGRTR